MTFASPWAFLLFLPLSGIVLLRWLRRKRNAIPFSSTLPAGLAGKSLRQRLLWTPPFCEIAAASLLILALARPQQGVRRIDDTTEGVAIEMVMDISSSMSLSMRSINAGSTRLEVAKDVFAQFVDGDGRELTGRPDDLIGLITFARYPNTVCPLTLGHDILLFFNRELEIEERPNEDGTAFGDALALAAARLKRVEDTIDRQSPEAPSKYRIRSKVAILLTDGENNCGTHLPLEAGAMARKWGVTVYTIGFGERKADDEADSPYSAKAAAVPLNATEKTLQRIAGMTGGFFRRAHDADSLRSVYAEIDRMEKTRFVDLGYIDYHDRFMPFAGAGLALLLLSIVLRYTWLRKT